MSAATVTSTEGTNVSTAVAQPSVSSHDASRTADTRQLRLASPHPQHYPHTVSKSDTVTSADTSATVGDKTVSDSGAAAALQTSYNFNLSAETRTASAQGKLVSGVEKSAENDAKLETPMEVDEKSGSGTDVWNNGVMGAVSKSEISGNKSTVSAVSMSEIPRDNLTASAVNMSKISRDISTVSAASMSEILRGNSTASAISMSKIPGDMSTASAAADVVADTSYDSDTDCQSGVNRTFTLTSSPVAPVSANRQLPVSGLLTSVTVLGNVANSPQCQHSGIHSFTHRHTSQRGPQTRAKPLFFRQKLNFSVRNQQPKMKKGIFYLLNEKTQSIPSSEIKVPEIWDFY